MSSNEGVAVGKKYDQEEERSRKERDGVFKVIKALIDGEEGKNPNGSKELVEKLLNYYAPNAIEDSKLVNSAIDCLSLLKEAEDAIHPRPLSTTTASDIIRSALFSQVDSPSVPSAQQRFELSKRQVYKDMRSDVVSLVTTEGKTADYRPGNVKSSHLTEIWEWFEKHSHESPAKRDEVVLAPACLSWYVYVCHMYMQ
jgi:hypothetical protein